jgi:sulfatase modifying factor 1
MSRKMISRCLRAALVSIAVGVCPHMAHAVTIDVVAVGNPGNSADTNGFGAVSSSYYISKYEVTIGQYVEFLNAVAKADPNGLWVDNESSGMNSTASIRGIARTGSDGSYLYTADGPVGLNSDSVVAQSAANRPITFVSWNNAARFANWMANGQPTGAQGAATTEDGAYAIGGGTTPALNFINPNTSAAPTYALPTSDQWYKAAYYDPTLNGAGGYWDYATQSDTSPGNAVGSSSNQANIVVGTNYSLTGDPLIPNQNYLTDVGSYSGSSSFYGTFDQTGNTSEWTDPGSGQSNALLRGGAWNLVALGAGAGVSTPITTADYDTGFRLVAAVPEPGTIGLLVSGVGCGLWQLMRRRRQRDSARRTGKTRLSNRSLTENLRPCNFTATLVGNQ